MQLQNYEEIIGILDKIEFHQKQGLVTLVFTFQKRIDLPIKECDMKLLVNSLGKKIALLRIDGDLKIRVVKNKNGEV